MLNAIKNSLFLLTKGTTLQIGNVASPQISNRVSPQITNVVLCVYVSGSEDSEEDLVTDYSTPPTIMSHQPSLPLYPSTPYPTHGGPLVPIISVTPHSPAGKQQYPVLGKYLGLNLRRDKKIVSMKAVKCRQPLHRP
jgi:hypothetical protein